MKRLIACLLLICLVLGSFSGCGEKEPAASVDAEQTDLIPSETEAPELEIVDYAGTLQLDRTSGTAQLEVNIKQFVDGDTTHFYVPTSVMSSGVLKARYLGINTPESTGKIEEWGKKASNFTKEKLSSATSIIIESETADWNADSTGDRYLCWVWYKPQGSEQYRNLNIEILQNGLAIANKSSENRYGETCMAAIAQAKAQKLHVHSGQKDPDFYYGQAIELTLKELRTNIEEYNNVRVAFHGVVTMNDSNSVYVESYDPETDMYYGMAVYYGFNLNGEGLEVLSIGNEVRIVGSVQYYEAGGTWQVSDLEYRLMKPDDPNNIQKLSEGNSPAYVPTSASDFCVGKVEVLVEDEPVVFDYAQLAMSSSVELKNLKVVDAYTTKKEDSASKGAFTLYCEVDGYRIAVRTTVLYDKDGDLVKQSRYMGKTINVKGIVDYYNGDYQIKVFDAEDIKIVK